MGAGDEALGIVQVAERRPIADEHWPGLEQVAGWARRELGARTDVDLPSVDVDRRPRSSVWMENWLRLDSAAADPELAERWSVRANEEAADDRFADADLSAPAIEWLGDSEVLDAQARLRPRIPNDVDGCLLSVFQPVSEKVVSNSGRLHRHPFPTLAVIAADRAALWKPSGGDSVNIACARKPVSSRASEPLLTSQAADLVVEIDDAGGDPRPAIVGAGALVGAVAAPLPLLRVRGGSEKCLRERFLVVRRDEPAGSRGNDLSGSVRFGGDHGQAAGHRLDQDEAERFRDRGKHEQVGGIQRLR